MTRFLSESLQAREPGFRAGITRLEQASDHPGTDILLSVEVAQRSRRMLLALGLDPHDTRPEELYEALLQRVKSDDQRLVRTLQTLAATHVSLEAEVVAGMVHALQRSGLNRKSFALKNARLRSLLREQPPKRAMKQLGYRSMDSMLRNEAPAATLTAAVICESTAWYRNFQERYRKLKAVDFETRQMQIVHPNSPKWQALALKYTSANKHNLMSFPELGSIVLLPIQKDSAPTGSATASLLLALQALNQVHSSGSYLKLCQVRSDFGQIVQHIARVEPHFSTGILEEPVSWQLLQRYYDRAKHYFSESVFEPHFSKEELSWQAIEHFLVSIEPSFAFWKDSAHVGIVFGHKPLSFNLTDAALNYANHLPFEQRIAHYYQKSLWHELLLRYLEPSMVEQTIVSILQPSLIPEMAIS